MTSGFAEPHDAYFSQPRNPDDLGRGPLIIGFTWALMILAVGAVCLRMWVMGRPKGRGLMSDDWLMFAAMVRSCWVLNPNVKLTISRFYKPEAKYASRLPSLMAAGSMIPTCGSPRSQSKSRSGFGSRWPLVLRHQCSREFRSRSCSSVYLE